jgi:hypothetical protein
MAKVAEKVPSWVARILLPELRAIVKEEVAAEVKRVEEKMSGEITALRTDIKRIEEKMGSEITAIRSDIKRVEEKISSEITSLRTDIKRVEEKMSGEITALRTDIKRIEDTLSTKVDSLGKMLDLVKQVAVLEAKVKELEAKQAQKS